MYKYDDFINESIITTSETAVIVAHPDDESFGFAGLIQRKAVKGVDLFTLTRGKKGNGNVTNRPQELKKASKILGINKVFLFDIPDGELKSYPEKIRTIIDKLLNLKYKMVATMHPNATSHPDHIIISNILLDSSTKTNRLFQYLPNKLQLTISKEETSIINLSKKEQNKKKLAIKCHKSQTHDINRILPNMLDSEYYLSI